jgi:hypothetical protein
VTPSRGTGCSLAAERGGSCAASHEIVGPLGGFLELVVKLPTYDSSLTTLAVDGGLTLGLSHDVQLDAGTRLGAAGPIADIELFVGASARI